MASGAALLILDMQNDIRQFHGKPEELKQLIGNIKSLADWARSAGITVIHSRVAFRPSYVDCMPHAAAFLKERNMLNESLPGSASIPELAPQPGDIDIVRRRVSAFYNTDLEVVLRGLKANTLLLTGMSTARVVESTARDANDRDYNAIVVSDCCDADTHEKHENALKAIADFFGKVMTAEEVKKALG